MNGIKVLLELGKIFKSARSSDLQGGSCRLHPHKKQKSVFHPSENSAEEIFVNIGCLIKPLNFRIICLSGFVFFMAFVCPNPAFSDEKGVTPQEESKIFDMGFKALMDLPVTTPTKKPESRHKAASAVYVLTQEDIRRSGAVNIMEALRMVPGVLVSKINQNRYAISIRGFNRRLGSDKLLVLMDGRSIYSPVSSGVFWIGQDTVLEDIERIEVIRGPGAALWGSNAVAGVINIITKSAGKTQGGLVAGGVGTEERGFGTLRYGGKLGGKSDEKVFDGEVENELNYRVYAKYRDRDDGKSADAGQGSNQSYDDKQIGQGGFRTDWQINSKDNLTTQGDYYRLNSGLDFTSRFVSIEAGSKRFLGPNVQQGGNFLTRWNHKIDDSSSYQLQFYYDHLKRKSAVPFDTIVDQYDIDFQHNFSFDTFEKNHDFSWGLNYRYVHFDRERSNIVQISRQETHLASLFLHDEIQLMPELSLILGTKVEYNVFTGFEFQPNVRTAWNPHPDHTIWAAFSRAVRLPNLSEEDFRINRILLDPGFLTANPTLVQEVNDGRTDAEVLLAYELGYRIKASEKLNFDLTAYYFDYKNLIELNEGIPTQFFQPGPSTPTGFHDIFPVFHDNSLEGEVFGAELSGQWEVLKNWRLSGSYTFAEIQLNPTTATIDRGSFNADGDIEAEGEPQHIFNIRSYLSFPAYNLEFDTFYYYVSKNKSRSIPEYGRLDVRLGLHPMKNVDLSFVAQNLLDKSHPELNELLEEASETQRSYYLKATLKF
jgi:iron complex outermembrane receptor protein